MRGFTIIEFSLVLFFLGILSYVLVASFSTDSLGLEQAQAKLKSDLHLAKHLSLTTGTTHGIAFEVANDRYTVFQNNPATPIADPSHRGQSLIIDYNNDKNFVGVNLASAVVGVTSTIQFDAQGQPRDGNGNLIATVANIVLSNASGSKTIQVAPETGKVSVP